MRAPLTQTVAGNGTLNFDGGPKQIAISNLDGSNNTNVKINNDPNGQTIIAGANRGWRFNDGIYVVQITGVATVEITTK